MLFKGAVRSVLASFPGHPRANRWSIPPINGNRPPPRQQMLPPCSALSAICCTVRSRILLQTCKFPIHEATDVSFADSGLYSWSWNCRVQPRGPRKLPWAPKCWEIRMRNGKLRGRPLVVWGLQVPRVIPKVVGGHRGGCPWWVGGQRECKELTDTPRAAEEMWATVTGGKWLQLWVGCFYIKAMGAELTAEANAGMNNFCSENEACECEWMKAIIIVYYCYLFTLNF